jgi:hypothetical protein
MGTLKILIILYIIFGFISQGAESQVSQKLNLKAVKGGKFESNVNSDTAFSRINTSAAYNLNFLITRRTDLTVQKDLTVVIPAIDYFDLINNQSSIRYRWAASIIKPVLPDYLITDTANNNWSDLILNPPSGVNSYYNHSKRTNQSNFSDNILYKISGDIFKAYTKSAYPGLSAPKK